MIDAKVVENNGSLFTRINGIWYELRSIQFDERYCSQLHERFHDELMKRTPVPGMFIPEGSLPMPPNALPVPAIVSFNVSYTPDGKK